MTLKALKNRIAAHACSVLLLGAPLALSACNGTDGAQSIEPDWIHHATPESPAPNAPAPSPSAISSPEPVPTPSPTPTPTPTPTGTPTSVTDLYTGPAEVAQFVQDFIDDAKAQGVDPLPNMTNPKLQIQIASLSSYGSSVIGLCETGGIRRVTFDPTFWNSASDPQKFLLSHHELGHCVLYRPHRNDLLPSGDPASIMYPVILNTSTYLNNAAYYLQELFSKQTASTSSSGAGN